MVTIRDIQNRAEWNTRLVNKGKTDEAIKGFDELCELIHGLPDSPQKTKAIEIANGLQEQLNIFRDKKWSPGDPPNAIHNIILHGGSFILTELLS